jgi:predicted GNAT family N-acyltransferase
VKGPSFHDVGAPPALGGKTLRLAISAGCPTDLKAVRQLCWPGLYNETNAIDCFDARSTHIQIYHDVSLIGVARLMASAGGVFDTWTSGHFPIPTSRATADLNRIGVVPAARQLKLSKLLIAMSILEADRQGYRVIRGAVRAGRQMQELLTSFAFYGAGAEIDLRVQNEIAIRVLPLHCNVAEALPRAQTAFRQECARFCADEPGTHASLIPGGGL